MAKTMIASPMTYGQIENLVAKYREGLRKHREEFDSKTVQLLLGTDNLGMVSVGSLRKLIEDEYTINCWDYPYNPQRLLVNSHTNGGQSKLTLPLPIELYVSEQQSTDVGIKGWHLRKELERLQDKYILLNASVMDYHHKNPRHIPDPWWGKKVFFWGTIFRDLDNDLYVGCLDLYDGCCTRDYRWLNR